MLKPTAPTGVFPNGGDGDRWSYMRDGRVIWSGSYDECIRRFKPPLDNPPDYVRAQQIERAIRAV